jgi:hypothetical protein
MDFSGAGRNHGPMIHAEIVLVDPSSPATTIGSMKIALDPGYGATAEVAHRILNLCVFAAERPVILEASGRLVHVQRALVGQIRVTEE